MSKTDPFIAAMQQWREVFMRRSMRNFIHFARKSGLSMSQLGTLFHLQRSGSSGVTDLGDHLGVSSAASSQLLDRLVQQKLILRAEDPKDRRVKQIALTEKGSLVLEDSMHARQDWLCELGDALSDREKEQIIIALNILIQKSRDLD